MVIFCLPCLDSAHHDAWHLLSNPVLSITFRKLQRKEGTATTVHHNFITDNIEQPLDQLHDKITAIMDGGEKKEDDSSNYKAMKDK